MIHKKLLSLLVLLMTTVSMSAKVPYMQISVTVPTGNSITLKVTPDYTIGDVKETIEQQTLIPTELQILTFNNQVLVDEQSVGYYDIEDDPTLTLSLVSGNYYLNGGSTQNCPVSFKVGNNENAGTAQEGNEVTVTFTPTAPYVLTAVTAQAYTTWAGARRAEPEPTPTIPVLGDITLTPVQGQANTYTFTMPPSHVKFNTTLLQEYEVDLTVNGDDAQGTEKALWTGKAGEQGTAKNFPIKAKTGQAVTISYNGRRKVKSVKAVLVPEKYLKWDAEQEKLVATEIPATAKKVENTDVEWEAGTYLVDGNVTINGGVTLAGDVELIIKDGAKLTADWIDGDEFYSLNVYGQAAMSGELNVAYSYGDAIHDLTVLNIHSCKVNASSSSVNCGGFFDIGEFNLYRGSVDAKYIGDSYGYGLGDISSLNIRGGEMKVEGKGDVCYGIRCWEDTNVTVYGGKLWVKNADSQALEPSDRLTFTKHASYTDGKIETSDDGTEWTVYNGSDKPDAKYVRVGY